MAKNKKVEPVESEERNAPATSSSMTFKGLIYKLSIFEEKDKVAYLEVSTINPKTKKVLDEKRIKFDSE